MSISSVLIYYSKVCHWVGEVAIGIRKYECHSQFGRSVSVWSSGSGLSRSCMSSHAKLSITHLCIEKEMSVLARAILLRSSVKNIHLKFWTCKIVTARKKQTIRSHLCIEKEMCFLSYTAKYFGFWRLYMWSRKIVTVLQSLNLNWTL